MWYRPLWFTEALLAATTLFAAEKQDLLGAATRLLNAGHVESAERMVRSALKQGADARGFTILGDVLFREGEFEEAAASYQAALKADARFARAWLGFGRLEFVQFHRTRARELVSRAYGLDPRDPDVIRAFAAFMTDAESRMTLLKNAVILSRRSDLAGAEDAAGQLEIETRLNGRRPARLESPYRDYSIELLRFIPAGRQTTGLLVPVSFNGGRALRLVLDTGARGVSISAQSARHLGLETLSQSRIGGLGGSAPLSANVMLARTAAIGDLVLGDCLVEVTPEPMTQGADGVIGMTLFEAFEIHLNGPALRMNLKPFAEPPVSAAEGLGMWMGWDRREPLDGADSETALYGFGHFLMLKGTVNGREGLFLVDTGASVTSLAREFAPPAINKFAALSFHGAAGEVQDAFPIPPVTVHVSGQRFFENEPVSLNLSELSRRQGVTISGILGYPALSRAPVTINYRDGFIGLSARQK